MAVPKAFANRLRGPSILFSAASSAIGRSLRHRLVDELYGGRLQGTPYYVKRSATWLMATGFEVSDGHKADAFFGKFLLAPVE